VEQKPNAPSPSEQRQRPPVNTPKPEAQKREYVIKSGDSLSKIAKQFYGNTDWQKIYEANKGVIKDPNMIFPGQKIIIP
jgi:nucleoid-associated protein YgaU